MPGYGCFCDGCGSALHAWKTIGTLCNGVCFKRRATRCVGWSVVIGQYHGNCITSSICVLFMTLALKGRAPQTPCKKSPMTLSFEASVLRRDHLSTDCCERQDSLVRVPCAQLLHKPTSDHPLQWFVQDTRVLAA